MKTVLLIKKLREFCKKYDFRYVASPIITAKVDGNTSPYSLRINDDDLLNIVGDLNKITKEFEEKTKKVRKTTFKENSDACPLIRFSSYIDCKGDVHPCNSFVCTFGNILESDFLDIWNNSQKFKEVKSIKKKDLHKCTQCDLKDICDRCPGLALLEDGDLLGCSTLAKTIANVNHKLQLINS